MNTTHNPIKFYETVIGQCPYLEEQKSASILVDPEHEVEENLFALLSHSGFRRSGEMLYKPKCPSCEACVSVRIPVNEFKASKNQKRVWRKNQHLSLRIEDVSFKQEHFDLYMKYQQARHPDSSMCDENPEKYTSFIDSYFSKSKFLCFYDTEQLVGISVIDQFKDGISAVYTFFDPNYSQLSIGTLAVLHMIEIAKRQNIAHVYLGYWIAESQKMNYKRNFKPLQGYIGRNWVDLSL